MSVVVTSFDNTPAQSIETLACSKSKSSAADDTVIEGGRLKVDSSDPLIASSTPAPASLSLHQNYRDFSIARLLHDSRHPSPSASGISALPLDLRRSRDSGSGEESEQYSESVASVAAALYGGIKQVDDEGRVAAVAVSGDEVCHPGSFHRHQYCAGRHLQLLLLLQGHHHGDQPMRLTSAIDDQRRMTDTDHRQHSETHHSKDCSHDDQSQLGRATRAAAVSRADADDVITGDRKKKSRTVFTRRQIGELESTFVVGRYLSSVDRCRLAARLQLSETQVKIWFQNRRNKWKRQTATSTTQERCLQSSPVDNQSVCNGSVTPRQPREVVAIETNDEKYSRHSQGVTTRRRLLSPVTTSLTNCSFSPIICPILSFTAGSDLSTVL